MLLPKESPKEPTLLLEQSETTLNQLISELPLVDGQKVLMLCEGDWKSVQAMVDRNQNGHLYMLLGPEEENKKQMTGWTYNSNLTFLYSRLTSLPLPKAFLDKVIIAYSPLLFQFKQAIVKEVCRVLKPGGIFHVLYLDVKDLTKACCFEIKKD